MIAGTLHTLGAKLCSYSSLPGFHQCLQLFHRIDIDSDDLRGQPDALHIYDHLTLRARFGEIEDRSIG